MCMGLLWTGRDKGKQKGWESKITYFGGYVNECVWRVGGKVVTREFKITGRKIQYSVVC